MGSWRERNGWKRKSRKACSRCRAVGFSATIAMKGIEYYISPFIRCTSIDACGSRSWGNWKWADCADFISHRWIYPFNATPTSPVIQTIMDFRWELVQTLQIERLSWISFYKDMNLQACLELMLERIHRSVQILWNFEFFEKYHFFSKFQKIQVLL